MCGVQNWKKKFLNYCRNHKHDFDQNKNDNKTKEMKGCF